MACKLCNRNEPRPNGLCTECMTELGVIEMPSARRKASPCTKCNGLKFVRVIPREYTIGKGGDWNNPEIAPMTLTQEPRVSPRLVFSGNTVDAPRVNGGFGMLEAYTCMTCGFIEWCCADVLEIPLGPEYMSEVVDYASATPYR